MTIDEHDKLEYDLMMKQKQRIARQQEEKKELLMKLGVKDPDNPDDEVMQDLQTMKDREWDNYKDDHEKGSGNRYGKWPNLLRNY